MTKRSVYETGTETPHPAVRGAGIIFYIKQSKQFMFYLRDDKDSILFPNMVSILGGHMEPNETAEETAMRELGEELTDLDTGLPFQPKNITHFKTHIDDMGFEQNIFGCVLDTTPNLRLHEGQRLVFLSRSDLPSTAFAFGFDQTVQDFARTV